MKITNCKWKQQKTTLYVIWNNFRFVIIINIYIKLFDQNLMQYLFECFNSYLYILFQWKIEQQQQQNWFKPLSDPHQYEYSNLLWHVFFLKLKKLNCSNSNCIFSILISYMYRNQNINIEEKPTLCKIRNKTKQKADEQVISSKLIFLVDMLRAAPKVSASYKLRRSNVIPKKESNTLQVVPLKIGITYQRNTKFITFEWFPTWQKDIGWRKCQTFIVELWRTMTMIIFNAHVTWVLIAPMRKESLSIF